MYNKSVYDIDGLSETENNSGYPGMPIAEIVTNGFFTVDRKWKVTYWNKAAETLLGISSAEILGKNLWIVFADIIPVEFYTAYHKAFLHDIPIHFEEYWGEFGAWFDVITYHVEDSLFVSFKSSKQPAHPAYWEHPDRQLKVLNELYRFVTEVSNDCLWEWNLQTKEIFWIDGVHKKAFGYDIENSLIPQGFWESCVHPSDKSRILAKLSKVIGDKATLWEDDYRFKKSDGEYAYVHDRGHILYDEYKTASRMVGTTRDITTVKVSELKLLETEQKLSLIARQTVNAVIITDQEGKITWVNDAFSRITSYHSAEVMGRKPGDFLQGEETDPATVLYLSQQIKNKQPFDCEILNYTKHKKKYWVQIQGQPLWDEYGTHERYFAIQTDITEKRLLENKLIQERLTKQREITLAVIAAQENERSEIGKELHDNLNQVLGAAKLYIEVAKTDDENREICLEKSSRYIIQVIDEIRKISKSLATPCMIMGLFESIDMLVFDLLIVHSIKISFKNEGVEEQDLGKRLQLEIFRIIQEQLNNILKHSRAKSAIIILRKDSGNVILIIRDNGVGCNINQNFRGTGLMNIKSRAEVMGGLLTIASNDGQGFEIKVMLPMESSRQGLSLYPCESHESSGR